MRRDVSLEPAMNRMHAIVNGPATLDRSFVIRFCSLFKEGRALTFPCDAQGHVDLDALPERARGNYLFARALVGRDYSSPRVCPAD
jgi:hypothetical protein